MSNNLNLVSYLGQPMRIALTVQQLNEYLDSVPVDKFKQYTISEVEVSPIAQAIMSAADDFAETTRLDNPTLVAMLMESVATLATTFTTGKAIAFKDVKQAMGKALFAIFLMGGNFDDMRAYIEGLGWRDDIPSPLQLTIPEVLQQYQDDIMREFANKKTP